MRKLILLAALAVCGGAKLESQVGATPSALRSRAELADASFSSFDPVTCMQSDVQIFVNRTWNRLNHDPTEFAEFAFMATIRLTPCDGEPIVVGQGFADQTDQIDFDLGNNVRRARLRVPSFPFTDYTHSVDMNLSVDISWDGDGPPEQEHWEEVTHDEETGATTRARYSAKSNLAVATGIITDGSSNWIPEPSVTGSMLKEKLDSLTITHRPRR